MNSNDIPNVCRDSLLAIAFPAVCFWCFFLITGCGTTGGSASVDTPPPIDIDEAANGVDSASRAAERSSEASKVTVRRLQDAKDATERARIVAVDIYNHGAVAREGNAVEIVKKVDDVATELTEAQAKADVVVELSEDIRAELNGVRVDLMQAQKAIGHYESAFNSQKLAHENAAKRIVQLENEILSLTEDKAKLKVWAGFTKWALGILVGAIILYIAYLLFTSKLRAFMPI